MAPTPNSDATGHGIIEKVEQFKASKAIWVYFASTAFELTNDLVGGGTRISDVVFSRGG